MKPKRTTSSAQRRRVVGWPRKVAEAIQGLPAGLRRDQLPKELVTALENMVKKLGPERISDLAKIYGCLRKRISSQPKPLSMVEEFERVNVILDTVCCDNPTFNATVPITLRRLGSQKLDQIGSGVLLRIVDRTFLLTAAHVTDQNEDGVLYVPGREGFTPANGYFSSMRLPTSGRRDDDKFDVSYYWLDRNCVCELDPRCLVLERPDVLLEGAPELCTSYSVAGYPWRRSRASPGAVTTGFLTMTGIEASASQYQVLGLRPFEHIAIQFNPKRAYSQRLGRVIKPPTPYGMSGGGVYAWSQPAVENWPVRLPLVGIANRFIPSRGLLIATRLHVYLNCIFHEYPDLAASAGA